MENKKRRKPPPNLKQHIETVEKNYYLKADVVKLSSVLYQAEIALANVNNYCRKSEIFLRIWEKWCRVTQ